MLAVGLRGGRSPLPTAPIDVLIDNADKRLIGLLQEDQKTTCVICMNDLVQPKLDVKCIDEWSTSASEPPKFKDGELPNEGDSIRKIWQLENCGHEFHLACISGVVTSTNRSLGGVLRCPVCRTEVSSDESLKIILAQEQQTRWEPPDGAGPNDLFLIKNSSINLEPHVPPAVGTLGIAAYKEYLEAWVGYFGAFKGDTGNVNRRCTTSLGRILKKGTMRADLDQRLATLLGNLPYMPDDIWNMLKQLGYDRPNSQVDNDEAVAEAAAMMDQVWRNATSLAQGGQDGPVE